MIKVLFLIESLSGGGAEKVLRNLVNHMDQSRFDITVQTINQENKDAYLVPGIHYKAINKCKSELGKKIFSYWFRLCTQLGLGYLFYVKGDYDIEIAYLETISTKIIAQSSNKHARKLAWVHCDMTKKEGISENKGKLSKQYARFDDIICVSEDVKNSFESLFLKKYSTRVINNVIDDAEVYKQSQEDCDWDVSEETVKLLAVGRLSKQKNYPYLLDTCAQLKRNNKKFQLLILGEGPEHNSLKKKIEEIGLVDDVKLLGFVSNPYKYMRKADVVVCSSLYEGISTVVQEALLLGKVIVTTPCTGMKELLGESKYGIISDFSERGLYDSLASIIDNPLLMDYYLKQSKIRGCSLKMEHTVKKNEELLEQHYLKLKY